MKTNILNDAQNEAVKHGDGPLLIVAGAGTGKTTVITEKIKHLLLTKKLDPTQILALTFTEKAAREMEERVDIALPYGYSQLWISTFHSFGDRILRNEANHIGLDPRYKLASVAESIRFVKSHLFDFELNYFRPLGNPTKFLSGLISHFSRLQDEDISPDEYLEWSHKQISKKNQNDAMKKEAEKWVELANTYKKYEDLKAKEGIMDFADLVGNTLKLFRKRPNLLKTYQDQFKYILVDEFQDTNISQNTLVKLLAGEKGNLTVVADDDQAIYRWRGAAISNVIQFRQSYPHLKVVALTQNYRSTQNILDTAYKLIQHNNPDRLEVREKINKKLHSSRGEAGSAPEFIHTDRVENEAEAVSKKILEKIESDKLNFSDFAILVRANNHSEPFTRALERFGIPFQFLGPGQLYHQPEIKELFAYLKLLTNLEDSQAFYKILTMDYLDINPRDLSIFTTYAKKYNLSLFETAEKVDDIFVTNNTKEKIGSLVKIITNHLKLIPRESAGQILYNFLESTKILKTLLDAKNTTDEKKAQNIAKFFDRLKTYETEHEDSSVFAVVDWIELAMDLGESPLAADIDWTKENAVNILTIHSSKGLEFPVVFVTNLVDQRFPTRERRELIPIPEELIKEILPTGNYHLQEERRLAYVALTRAKDELYLTAADFYGEAKRVKKISPFVPEALGRDALSVDVTPKAEQLSILNFAPIAKSGEHPTLNPPLLTYLSFSQIDTFNFCPMHYKLRYICNIPTPPAPAQSFGITLHLVLKEISDRLKNGNPPTPKNVLDIYEKLWIPLGYAGKSHEKKTKEKGKDYLVQYLKTQIYNPKNPPLGTEVPFSFHLTPNLKIGGKIDRVDKTENGIEIIDYKTTDLEQKGLPTKNDLSTNLQLSIYALASCNVKDPIFENDPKKVTLSLYFFNKATKVSTIRTAKQLEKAKAEILKVKEAIENSNFECNGDYFCANCEYKLFCKTS